MEDMIRKSEVLNRLRLLRTETDMNAKIPVTKRKAIVGCVERMLTLVDEIRTEEKVVPPPEVEDMPIEETEEAEAPAKPEVRKVPKDHSWEPIMIGSNIGIQRYRCRKCSTVVELNDLYCRHCGSLFGDVVEHKNRQWDSTRKRPVERR